MGTVEVAEYYFSDYYRVVVIGEDNLFIVSVDVYRKGWLFSGFEEKCVSNGLVCARFKTLENPSLPEDLSSITEKVIVEGIKASGAEETISVKWLLNRKPTLEEVSRIHELSWRLIKCQPPSTGSFNVTCE